MHTKTLWYIGGLALAGLGAAACGGSDGSGGSAGAGEFPMPMPDAGGTPNPAPGRDAGSSPSSSPGSDAGTPSPTMGSDGSTTPPPPGGQDGGSSPSPVDDGGSAPDAAAVDASGGAPAEAGPATGSGNYPAFAPDFGQIVGQGGAVLTNPVIVSITWDSDPGQSTFDAFVDGLGSTAFWKATTSEYGVGPASSGAANHVHISTAAPATMGDANFKKLVAMNAGSNWPAATDQIIYAFFLPPHTGLNVQGGGGDACASGVGGYHDQANAGSTIVSYAIVPSCTFTANTPAMQQSTESMSHELIEAVTDPRPQLANPGYVGFDNAHFSFDWFQSFQSETGDACELFRTSFFQDMEPNFNFWVQRTWSNASAKAGHNPCVPVPPTAYFNVTPIGLGMVNVDTTSLGGAGTMATEGVHIMQGKTGTIDLGFYSDGPTSGPWTLDTIEGGPLNPVRTPRLTVMLDKTMGTNGDHATATITVNAVGPLKAELLTFRSTLGTEKHYMPVVIGSE
jgi:hypothetical protein